MSDLIHLRPTVKVLMDPFEPTTFAEIVSVSYGDRRLTITLDGHERSTEVAFDYVFGYRVLDELDLTEFWSQCSLRTGWLFEVTAGGWKALEMSRASFVSGRMHEDLREFLVIGVDDCVSVLSKEAPEVRTNRT